MPSAPGLYTYIKSYKCIKADFKEIALKLATTMGKVIRPFC